MKNIKLYLTALLFASLGIASCDDNWDTPPLDGPKATMEANTTIADLKAQYWFEGDNGVDTVGLTEDKEHIVIRGRVVSSDASGNIYKNLVIQDETAAITMSINANSLYNSYRLGQEVVVDVTDMYIGKYAGLQQFGFPDFSEQFGWQTTFMPLEFFQKHVQLNGLPEPARIDTLSLKIADLPGDVQGIQKYQSQLVRFDNVQFADGGKLPFAEYQVTKSRTITDGSASLDVRTSGYANFYNKTLPEGMGSVVGILGYFNGSWQLTLRSYEDCIFGDQEGGRANPYTVEQAIANQGKKTGWVQGVIVGAVKPGISAVASSADIEWAAPFSLPNTLVIADKAGETDYAKCVVVELPQNSDIRSMVNLADNADNLGETVIVSGQLENKFGMAGIVMETGGKEEFVFNGTVTVTSLDENFDSYGAEISKLVSSGWTNATVSGDKDWWLKTFGNDNNTYATMSGYNGKQPPFDAWLITPAVNIDKVADKVLNFRTQVAGYGSKTSVFEVYVLTDKDPEAATKTKLDPMLAEPSASATYSEWQPSGNVDLSSFSGKIYIGFRFYATQDENYATWCVDDVKVGVRGEDIPSAGDRTGAEDNPYTVADIAAGIAGSDVWVKGYIVGYSSGTNAATGAKFTAEGASALNVLLADSADEKDVANCIAVALPSGDVKNAINLKDNPANLGKQVQLKGSTATYLRINGLTGTSAYKFL